MSGAGRSHQEMPGANGDRIIFTDVSKFYGEVLGVNKINLTISPGITSLVGPNGSGKTTLMNLMTGLIRPTRGDIEVLGIRADDPETYYRKIGYCPQFDTFPKGFTGFELIASVLRLHGRGKQEAEKMAWRSIEQVHMTEAAHRRIAAYSKGMRQRIKLALAVAHQPAVLVLDEPLNGLDPMARAETIALFEELAENDLFVIVSSHILHEVDIISDSVVMMSNGYIVAEGDIQDVRGEIAEHPIGILIRCDKPALLASRAFSESHVAEVRIDEDGAGVLVRTRSVDQLYMLINRVVLEDGLIIEGVTPIDEDVHSVYSYLIGSNGTGRL